MSFLSTFDKRFMFQGLPLARLTGQTNVGGVYQISDALSDVTKYLSLTSVCCVLSERCR